MEDIYNLYDRIDNGKLEYESNKRLSTEDEQTTHKIRDVDRLKHTKDLSLISNQGNTN